jgi:hypothetical protein
MSQDWYERNSTVVVLLDGSVEMQWFWRIAKFIRIGWPNAMSSFWAKK